MIPSSCLYCHREWGVDEAFFSEGEGCFVLDPFFSEKTEGSVENQPVMFPDPVASLPTLEALRGFVENFHGCALRRTAQNTVFSDGCAESSVMLIGLRQLGPDRSR